ncbi:hypothetical protein [Caproiciproducens sp. LBM24188]|nr:hypothetical protein [Oscillospiraceae bacterium]HHV32982.1 hypothetical protein [Clostridiales bacterium]
MPQFINGLKVSSNGTIRHVAGFGSGDGGYDVLLTTMRSQGSLPCVTYYFRDGMTKRSVSVAKSRGSYLIEMGTFADMDAPESFFNDSVSMRRVPRKYLKETAMAYRAYRILFNEFKGIREEILDAANGLEYLYLGTLSRDKDGLLKMLERAGFHPDKVDVNMIHTKEGICISPDGTCFKEI